MIKNWEVLMKKLEEEQKVKNYNNIVLLKSKIFDNYNTLKILKNNFITHLMK